MIAAGQNDAAPRGRFITFEGGEGAGKSTQMKRLAASLAERGIAVVETREPGGTPDAEAIRSFILSGRARPLGGGGEAVLFAAARADHVDRIIRPALARGAFVLSDRFTDSTRAYQGADGVDAGRIFRAEQLDSDAYWALANGPIDFLLIDLRLSTALPVLGFYFEPWEPRSAAPLSAEALLKFDGIEGITRIYDNGFIVIYDVRGLHGHS